MSQSNYLLKTQRLGFRTWTENDFDLAFGLWGDIEVTRLIGGPFSREQVQTRLFQEISTQEKYQVQYWPIFLIDTGEHVGCAGLRPYDLPNHVYEIGFHIRPIYWRQGFASEAARGVMEYAFNILCVKALFAGHNPKNEASRNLLLKLGFDYTHDEYYAPTGLLHPSYRLTSDEYRNFTQ